MTARSFVVRVPSFKVINSHSKTSITPKTREQQLITKLISSARYQISNLLISLINFRGLHIRNCSNFMVSDDDEKWEVRSEKVYANFEI